MSTLVDKTYLLLPDEVLWNITRLSRFALVSFVIKEEGSLATLSLIFDKTGLSKKYAEKLRGKYKTVRSSVDLSPRKVFDFDPESPLKPPITGQVNLLKETVLQAHAREKSSSSNTLLSRKEICKESSLNNCSIAQDVTGKVKIKQEPMSPMRSSSMKTSEHDLIEEKPEEDLKLDTKPISDELLRNVKMEKDCTPVTKPPGLQREKVSFQVPGKALPVQQNKLFDNKYEKSSKPRQITTKAVRQCDSLRKKCDEVISKMSKVTLSDDKPDWTKKAPNQLEEKHLDKDSKRLDKGKYKAKSETNPDKENTSPYHETVKYFLHKAYKNIELDPKTMSKYDFTYSIEDNKDCTKFTMKYWNDRRKDPPIKIDSVSLKWLRANSKQIPSYIRKQATYRLVQQEFSHCRSSDVVPMEKRELIYYLLD